jgi:thiol-disulfide isomerase/thioredoxin
MHLTDALNGGSRPLCAGKKSCLVVYISPWCPSCKQELPFIKEVSSAVGGYPGFGLEVIIGWDKRSNLFEMAQGLGIDSLLDDQGLFATAASVSSVPSWYLFGDGSLYRALSPGTDSAVEFAREAFLTRPIIQAPNSNARKSDN